jgi:hypothetical protein
MSQVRKREKIGLSQVLNIHPFPYSQLNFFIHPSSNQKPKKYSSVEKILEGHLPPLVPPSSYAYGLDAFIWFRIRASDGIF